MSSELLSLNASVKNCSWSISTVFCIFWRNCTVSAQRVTTRISRVSWIRMNGSVSESPKRRGVATIMICFCVITEGAFPALDLLLWSSAWRGTKISHCLRHTACLTARVDVFCDHGHSLNHMIVVRISGRSWREPVLNLTSRKPNEQVRWLILGVATPLSHLPLGQEIGSEKTSNRCCELWMVGVRRAIQLSHLHSINNADSDEPPPTSELPGWLVHGVATRLSHMPFDQDTESLEPPSSSVLTGCLVHGVATQLSHRPHHQNAESPEPPPSSVLSGWLALALQHKCHIFQSTWDQSDVLDQRSSSVFCTF